MQMHKHLHFHLQYVYLSLRCLTKMNTTAMRLRRTRREHTRPAVRAGESPSLESATESGVENMLLGALAETHTTYSFSTVNIKTNATF